MWWHHSETLAPMTWLTSKDVLFKWTDKEQKAFDVMKKIISRDVHLAYPDFNKPFHVRTNASNIQLGACISQEGKHIAFYSKKLNQAQHNYTTGKKELLLIIETLKDFCNILLGQKLHIYTDHTNLIFKKSQNQWIIKWCLILKEYRPDSIWLKGKKNQAADTLSQLSYVENDTEEHE